MPLDNDVRFEWTQTLPGRGMCGAGKFIGPVTCNIEGGIPGTHLDGTLVLDLVGPSETQELDVETGSANFIVDPTNVVSLTVPVTGNAMCSNRFFAGEVPETTFTGDDVGLAFQLVLGVFCASGPMGNTAKGFLEGHLDPDSLSLMGDIRLTIGSCECSGPFDLRAQR
jgi:hypothetical protein